MCKACVRIIDFVYWIHLRISFDVLAKQTKDNGAACGKSLKKKFAVTWWLMQAVLEHISKNKLFFRNTVFFLNCGIKVVDVVKVTDSKTEASQSTFFLPKHYKLIDWFVSSIRWSASVQRRPPLFITDGHFERSKHAPESFDRNWFGCRPDSIRSTLKKLSLKSNSRLLKCAQVVQCSTATGSSW